MKKIILAFLPLFAMGQVMTKPYDDLKTGDLVVTNVTIPTVTVPVTSVNGQTGAVVITASDLGVDTNLFVPYTGATNDVDIGIYDLSASNLNATASVVIGREATDLMIASGGTVTNVGDYTIHTFSSNGTFVVTGTGTVECIIVGGGGGGASGGGGGGGFISSSFAINPGTYPVTVGEGGAGQIVVDFAGVRGGQGGNSSFNGYTAFGGGGGAGNQYYGDSTATPGGSGGGGGYSSLEQTYGALGTESQGYAGGGNSNILSSPYPAGGGGGAGGAGGDAVSNTVGGSGGIGINSSISGTLLGYGGGGGGGVYGSGTGGTASFGGGAGGANTIGSNGTDGRGGGGGGAGHNFVGGNGGDGVVIVRYLTQGVSTKVTLSVAGTSLSVNRSIDAGTNTITAGQFLGPATSATTVTGAQSNLIENAVQRTGDTMTGDLVISKNKPVFKTVGASQYGTIEFWNTDTVDQYEGVVGYETVIYPMGNPANAYFYRSASKYKLYDSGNFVAGTHYVASETDTLATVTGRGAITTNTISVPAANFDTNYTPTGLEPIGACYWDKATHTYVIVYPNGQKLNLGEECIFAIQNDTGVTISNGMTVMYAGSIGNSGNVRGTPAYVTPTTDVHLIYGMATTDIPNGESGKVTVRGKVRGIQTDGANVGETWVDTTELYITTDPDYAGFCTSVKPDAPYPAIRLGMVTASHQNNGTIDVYMQFPQRLADLADVDGTPLDTTGQLPIWDHTRKVFDFNYNYITDLAGKVSTDDTRYLSSVTNNQSGVTFGSLSIETTLGVTGIATFSTNAYSSIDHTVTAPANNELVTAGWVRGLAMGGAEWYYTTNLVSGVGEKTANIVSLSGTFPADAFTNSIASPVASSTYLAGGITTNTYTALRSPITIDAYLARVGGNTASVLPVSAEVYYVYANGSTNQLGDWSVNPQLVTSTSPTRFQWVVAFPEPTITGAVKVVAYLKTGTVSGLGAGINIYGGNGYSSHMDIQNVQGITTHNELSGRSTADAHPTSAITGLDTFIGSAVTNGQTSAVIGGVTLGASGNLFATNKLSVTAVDSPNYCFTIDSANASGPRIQLGGYGNPNLYFEIGAYSAVNNFDSKDRNLRLFGDGCEFRQIQATGFSGVNKPIPEATLHVGGTLTVDGVSKIILPTSTNGLASGVLWNDGGTVKVMP